MVRRSCKRKWKWRKARCDSWCDTLVLSGFGHILFTSQDKCIMATLPPTALLYLASSLHPAMRRLLTAMLYPPLYPYSPFHHLHLLRLCWCQRYAVKYIPNSDPDVKIGELHREIKWIITLFHIFVVTCILNHISIKHSQIFGQFHCSFTKLSRFEYLPNAHVTTSDGCWISLFA